ncbi:MAG: hypothetical protein SFU21_15335 [Flavihumibacter sp.]|nr:hypothetical protein [Flavihumibacter sp.]
MKTLHRLGLLTIMSIALFSCKKETITEPTPDTIFRDPVITSKIYPFINQPAPMDLGTTNTTLHAGDMVTVYMPYGVFNDNIVTSTLTLTDDVNGSVLGVYNWVPSTDASAATLNVPIDLRDVPFMFVTFTVDASMMGYNINLASSIVGKKTQSEDAIANAFKVDP